MKKIKSWVLIVIIPLTLSETFAKTPSIIPNSTITPKNRQLCLNHSLVIPPIFSANPAAPPNPKILKHHKFSNKRDDCFNKFDFSNLTTIPSKSLSYNETDCIHLTVTQSDLNQCSAQKAQDSTHKLNQFLVELQNILGSTNEVWLKLETLNQKWEQFKDKYCLWEKTFFGYGSVAPMVYSNCVTFYNTQRLARLKKILCENYEMTHYCKL